MGPIGCLGVENSFKEEKWSQAGWTVQSLFKLGHKGFLWLLLNCRTDKNSSGHFEIGISFQIICVLSNFLLGQQQLIGQKPLLYSSNFWDSGNFWDNSNIWYNKFWESNFWDCNFWDIIQIKGRSKVEKGWKGHKKVAHLLQNQGASIGFNCVKFDMKLGPHLMLFGGQKLLQRVKIMTVWQNRGQLN